MNVEEFIVPPLNLWNYAFSLYLAFKSIKRHSWTQRVCWIPTIPHTLHKIRQIIFLWLVIQSFILGCIPIYQIGVLRRLACPSTWRIGPASWEVWVKLVTADCKKSLIWSTVSEDQHQGRSNSFNSSHYHQGLHNVIILVTSPEGLPATSHGWPVTSLVKSGSSPNNVGNPRQYCRHLLDLSVRENHGGTRQVG